jgi:hypothetical protein
MMSFGWRPMLSCYASQAKAFSGQTSSTQQAVEAAVNATAAGVATPDQSAIAQAVCPSPSWFYAGLAIATFLGLTARGKR